MKKIVIILSLISLCTISVLSQEPVKAWNFDNQPSNIEGKFRLVNGVLGKALKLDGFTTVISEEPALLENLSDSFTLEGWIAMAAYPWNWCPVITQIKEETGGFSFEIGPRGELALKMHAGRNLHTCVSDETIPLREWTHIAARFDSGVGISLFINGILVSSYETSGKPAFAKQTEVRIGMNYQAVFPSNRIGENGITPYWFSLDGILDELSVYNYSVKNEVIAKKFNSVQTSIVAAPEISPRNFPTVESQGEFQAYYTKLEYYPEWDEQWPVGEDTDIVVTFENSPVKLIFWRGTRYSPAWVTDNNQWMCDQSVETWNDEEGCKEHMQDRHCRYSHVRLIENTPARKVIHWRYAPVSAYDTNWMANEKTGWEVWIDEYYYIYPDATGIRKVSWKTEYFGFPRQFQETLPLTGVGQTRADIMEIDYLKIANQQGDIMQLKYSENPRKEADLNIIESPNIQQHNFKSDYDPFIIFEPGNRMHYIMDRDIRNLDFAGSCNHWPVGQAYCDGRVTQAPDRPAHFLGFPISDPIVHDEPNGRSYWAGLYGMKDVGLDELIRLSRSWNSAPKLTIVSEGFQGGEYHKDEKCYIIESSGKSTDLEFSIAASAHSPLVNPAILIKNWTKADVKIELNGKNLIAGKEFTTGLVSKLEGSNLVVYLNLSYQNEGVFKISLKKMQDNK